MKNLDQIRALNALKATEKYTPQGENGGNVIKQVPAMIQQNGLLGAMAFAFDGKEGHKLVLQGAIEHYASVCNQAPADIMKFNQWIIQQDAAMLRASLRSSPTVSFRSGSTKAVLSGSLPAASSR